MKLNSYILSRTWFDFAFENSEKVNPNHTAIYFFMIEHCNRLGWKKVFGIPTIMTMEAVGVKSFKTYKKVFDDLVNWNFIKLHQKSKNQYSSNQIELVALVNNTEANTKALTKASSKHLPKQRPKQCQSIVDIIKHITYKPLNIEQENISFEILSDEELKILLSFLRKIQNERNPKPEKTYKQKLFSECTESDFETQEMVQAWQAAKLFQELFLENAKHFDSSQKMVENAKGGIVVYYSHILKKYTKEEVRAVYDTLKEKQNWHADKCYTVTYLKKHFDKIYNSRNYGKNGQNLNETKQRLEAVGNVLSGIFEEWDKEGQ